MQGFTGHPELRARGNRERADQRRPTATRCPSVGLSLRPETNRVSLRWKGSGLPIRARGCAGCSGGLRCIPPPGFHPRDNVRSSRAFCLQEWISRDPGEPPDTRICSCRSPLLYVSWLQCSRSHLTKILSEWTPGSSERWVPCPFGWNQRRKRLGTDPNQYPRADRPVVC